MSLSYWISPLFCGCFFFVNFLVLNFWFQVLCTHLCILCVCVCGGGGGGGLQMLVEASYHSLECLLSYTFPLFRGWLLDENFYAAGIFVFPFSCFFSYRSFIGSLISLLFLAISWAGLLFQEHSFLSVLWNIVCKWMMMVVERGRRKEDLPDFFFFLVCWILKSPSSFFPFTAVCEGHDPLSIYFLLLRKWHLSEVATFNVAWFWTLSLWPVLWVTVCSYFGTYLW